MNPSYQQEKAFLLARLAPYMKGTMAQWLLTLPLDFYLEIFKLHGWSFTISKIDEKAGLLARWTQAYIFKRLQKEVLDQLKRSAPGSIAEDRIIPHIQAQLQVVIIRMQAAPNWDAFVRSFRNEFGQVPFHFAIDHLSDTTKQQLEEALIRLSAARKMKRQAVKQNNL